MNMSSLLLKVSFMISCWLHVASCHGCESEINLCDWETWSQWSSCSQTCSAGTQTRSRDSCCMMTHELDVCLVQCNMTRDSFKNGSLETNTCVSPCDECTFKEYTNTGINITDFMEIYDNVNNNGNHKLMNTPVLIHCSVQYCQNTCVHSNLHNGLFCWGYTFMEEDKCLLYFYTEPLSATHPHLHGMAIGESLFLRLCNGNIYTTPTTGILTVHTTMSSRGSRCHQLQFYPGVALLVMIATFKF